MTLEICDLVATEPRTIHSCESVATVFPCGQSCDRVAETSTCSFRRPLLLEALAVKGVRLTVQRRALVETIQEATEHLDAVALLERARLREPSINRATVYRTLELLKKLGLIDELDLMHLNGEKHYYEARTQSDHLHLACFECGRIEEFVSPAFEELKRVIAQDTGFESRVTRLEVGGRCRQCRGKVKAAGS